MRALRSTLRYPDRSAPARPPSVTAASWVRGGPAEPAAAVPPRASSLLLQGGLSLHSPSNPSAQCLSAWLEIPLLELIMCGLKRIFFFFFFF